MNMEKNSESLFKQAKKRGVPEATAHSLAEYVTKGRNVGGFLEAVLKNDLKESFNRADLDNRSALFKIVMFLYNDCPMNCWGSPKKYEEWEGLDE